MSQALLFLAMHVLGLAVCLAAGPRHRPALCAALAFPVGLVAFVVVGIALLVARVPYGTTSLVPALIAVTGVAVGAAVRRGPLPAGAARVLAIWTAGFAVAAAALTSINVVLSTWDSHRMVMIARVAVEDGGFEPRNVAFMSEWGVFQVVAQTLAVLTKQDFLYGLPVVLGVSFVPLFAMTLAQALGARGVTGPWRWGGAALATAALFAIPMVDYHVIYLHTNFGSAIYLFLFCALFWLAEVEDEPSYVPPALIALTAFALHRTENPLIAVVFLGLVVAPSAQPRRVIGPWLGALVVVVGVWLERLAEQIEGGGALLTPTRARIIVAALVAAFAWWLASARPRIAAINRRLPQVIAVGGAVVLAAMFATKHAHMSKQAEILAENLTTVPYWAHAWYGLVLLAALALAFPAPPHRQAFAIGIPFFVAAILALAYGGHGYRLGNGDSANRMMVHVLPMIVWYLALKALPATGSRSRAGDTP